MNRNEKEQIREQARRLLRKVWANRSEWASDEIDEFQVCRMAPELIVTRILKYDLVKVNHIPSGVDGVKVAGVFDRQNRRIEIAKDTPFESRRFTLAHEIGHAIMHPQEVLLHRDRHSDGFGHPDVEKPLIEQQADFFAAELLMPSKLLTKVFTTYFFGRVDRSEIDNDFAYMLNSATSEALTVKQLRELRRSDLAIRLACIDFFGGNLVQPLIDRFGVSPRAMAIQLVEHDLVI